MPRNSDCLLLALASHNRTFSDA